MNNHQRANLLKLAAYLESLPPDYSHFGMRYFADHRGDCVLPMYDTLYAAKKPSEFLANCGTVACAVGHGPAAGIKPHAAEFGADSFDWSDYAERVFGTHFYSDEFDFLFGSHWVSIDNHHYGAAARIRCYLTTGNLPNGERTVRRKYAPYRKGSRSAKRREIDSVPA